MVLQPHLHEVNVSRGFKFTVRVSKQRMFVILSVDMHAMQGTIVFFVVYSQEAKQHKSVLFK